MSWLSSILIALVIAIGGGTLGLLLAAKAAVWRKVSTREGYAGYWVVFWALAAALWSLAAALLVTRLAGSASGLLDALLAAATAAAISAAGIGLAALLAWLSRDRPPGGTGAAPLFEFELRAPAGRLPTAPDSTALYGYLTCRSSGMAAMELDFARLRRAAEGWVLPGRVALQTRRPGAYLAVGGSSLGGATIYFAPDLPTLLRGPPGAWSSWLQGSPSGDLGPTVDGDEVLLRLRLAPPDPATPATPEPAPP